MKFPILTIFHMFLEREKWASRVQLRDIFVAQIIPFNSSKAMKIGGFPPQFAAVFVGQPQATLLFGRCWEPRSAGGTVDVPLKMRGGMVSEPSLHLRQDFIAGFLAVPSLIFSFVPDDV